MDFGRLPRLHGVDFRLPPDSPRTRAVLEAARAPGRPLAVHFGAPVWSRKEWVGKLYPAGAKSPEYLRHYARQLTAIELNTSFYRIPDTATTDAWRTSVPANFRFCPKFYQGITHEKELVGARELTQAFCESFLKLGDRLGLPFLQLPPTFHPRQLAVLEQFLDGLPPGFPVAVEFRHPAWFRERWLLDGAAAALEARGVATVITDVAGRRDVSHGSLTAPRALVRFIGNSEGEELHPTDLERIDAWVERIESWRQAGLSELYFFVHQPEDRLAPDLISYFVRRLNERSRLALRDWKRVGLPQLDLFQAALPRTGSDTF
jgi:uncharacterized protein YecE (DUF72 family)